MKRISLYSAICLVIIGIYSVSVFAQVGEDVLKQYGNVDANFTLLDEDSKNLSDTNLSTPIRSTTTQVSSDRCSGRSPSGLRAEMKLKYRISSSDPVGEKSVCYNPSDKKKYCKPAGYTQSVETFFGYFKNFMDDYRKTLKHKGYDLSEYESSLPRLDTVVENGKIKLKMKNVPRCFHAFNGLGDSLPNNSTGPNAKDKVMVPYLSIRDKVSNNCLNSDDKWRCSTDLLGTKIGNFFKRKFKRNGRNTEFTTKNYMDACLAETQKELKKNLKKRNDPEIISDEYVIEFDGAGKKNVFSSPKLDQEGEYCLNTDDVYEMADFRDYLYSDGDYQYRRELDMHCSNRAPGGLDIVDFDFLDNLKAISLKVNGENGDIIKHTGANVADILNLGDVKLAEDDNACNKAEGLTQIGLDSGTGLTKAKIDNFVTNLNGNVREIFQRYEKAQNEFANGNTSKAKNYLNSARGAIAGGGPTQSLYSSDKIIALAKTLSRSPAFVNNDFTKKLYESYVKLKRIENTTSVNTLPLNSTANIRTNNEIEEQARDLSVCTAYASIFDNIGDCNISHKKTQALRKFLEKKREDLKESVNDDEYVSPRSVASDSSDTSGIDPVRSLMNSEYSVVNEPPRLSDLDKRIAHLKVREKYLADNVEKAFDKATYQTHKERCVDSQADYDFENNEQSFLDKIAGVEKVEDEEDENDDDDDENSEEFDQLVDLMKMQMQMMYANGNSGAGGGAGNYNFVGGGNNMGWVQNAMSGFSNQLYSMAYNNYQMQGLFMDRQSSFMNNFTNYQYSTTNFLLENSMMSNYFNNNTLGNNFNYMNTFNPSFQTPTFNPNSGFVYNHEIPVFINEEFVIKIV